MLKVIIACAVFAAVLILGGWGISHGYTVLGWLAILIGTFGLIGVAFREDSRDWSNE